MEDGQKVSVLVVDDDLKNLLAYDAILDGLDLNLVKAASAPEALKQVLKRDFAVILMDVRMPGMDGFEAARLLRLRRRSQETPLIFATATYQEDVEVCRGYSLGAVDYLLKPVVPEI